MFYEFAQNTLYSICQLLDMDSNDIKYSLVRMRLSDEEKSAIKMAVQEHFGPDARVYLFGSRVDDRARGGDIDLYVESGLEGEELVEAKLQAMSQIQFRIGERKIDIVASSPTAENDARPVVKKAKETGVRL